MIFFNGPRLKPLKNILLPIIFLNQRQSLSKKIPKPPENCCMSGCPNCVWLTYVEELLQFYNDGGAKVREEIEKNIQDPGLRAFIQLELKEKFNIEPTEKKR